MLKNLLEKALDAREKDFESLRDFRSLRLFNGFYEGQPGLVADLYGRTLVLFDYGKAGDKLDLATKFYRERLPWLTSGIIKTRSGGGPAQKRGYLAFGENPDEKMRENGVWYALDLQMQQDASFYLDTRNLRGWLRENARGQDVLNTFAYTGSLGVAALAGDAALVIQTDLSKKFLELARHSSMLNHLDLGKMKLQAGNFFSVVAGLKQRKARFDCVIIDPPFFSSTTKGTIDLVNESTRLINKVRPLIKDGGYLVAINNALFLSGEAYMQSLEDLCSDGYLSVETIIPVPPDIAGFPETIINTPPVDPAPFNHPTKIAILRVRRKTS